MTNIPEPTNELKIVVDFKPGRWGNTYHIFDFDGREIALERKDAVRMARRILAIAKKKGEDKDG